MSSISEIKAAIKAAYKASDEVGGLVQEAATLVESYVDSKTDSWREGDKGMCFDSLRARLEEIADTLGELETIYDDNIG
jgi:hypothetical protein